MLLGESAHGGWAVRRKHRLSVKYLNKIKWNLNKNLRLRGGFEINLLITLFIVNYIVEEWQSLRLLEMHKDMHRN